MLADFNSQGMFFGIGEDELTLLLDGDRTWARQIVEGFHEFAPKKIVV